MENVQEAHKKRRSDLIIFEKSISTVCYCNSFPVKVTFYVALLKIWFSDFCVHRTQVLSYGITFVRMAKLHPITFYRIVFLGSVRFLGWMPLFVFFGLPILSCSLIKPNTRMLVTFGTCFKQHFDTRYLVFYNPSPPRMFLSLDLPSEYGIQHGTNGPLYVTSSYSTWIFCRGVSGFATDCPCGVWCRGLTTCLLHVGPPFGNRILNNSWAVGLT